MPAEPGFLPGLCSVTFRQLAPDAIIALAASAGLRAIEWGDDVHVPPGDTARAARVGRATSAAGLLPLSYGSYLAPGVAGSGSAEATLETAVALGAESIRVWAGRRGIASAAHTREERTAFTGALADFAEAALGAEVAMVIEYHPGTLTDTPDAALRLISEIGHPNAWLGWQPLPGERPAPARQAVARLSPHLAHLHIFAWTATGKRLPLDGNAELWRQVLGASGSSRYRGHRGALLEFVAGDTPAAMAADARVLRGLLQDPEAGTAGS